MRSPAEIIVSRRGIATRALRALKLNKTINFDTAVNYGSGKNRGCKISKKQAVKYAATAAYDYCGKEIKKVKYLGGGSFGRAVLVSFKDGAKIVIKLLRAKICWKRKCATVLCSRKSAP